jgi:propionate CoA-transferase
VIFGGTFTAGKSELSWPDGKMRIASDGKGQKLVAAVEQITYSGSYGAQRGQRALYITERAVFQLGTDGVDLIEVAPGVDIERDVLARMGFKPKIAKTVKTMDARIFRPERMNLSTDLASKPRLQRSSRLDLPEAAQ